MESAVAERLRRDAVAPPGPGAVAALVEPPLLELAGPGGAVVSMTADFGRAMRGGEPVSVEAWADRATRSLVFAQAELRAADGAVLAHVSVVLQRGV